MGIRASIKLAGRLGLGIIAGAPAPLALAAPITFNTALPVAQGEVILRALGVVESPKSGRAGPRLSRSTTNAVAVYGITPDLAVFAVLPVTFARSRAGATRRSADGIGDFRAFARYTLYRHDGAGRTFRIAPFLGLKIPTGDHARADRLGRLPPALQPGSGSWDLLGGMIVTYASVDWNFDFQAAYQANGAKAGVGADRFGRGDTARADASIQYRLTPRNLTASAPGFLYGVVEANLVHMNKARLNRLAVADSGGTGFYLAPGLQYASRRWIAELAVRLPVIQSLNGAGKDFSLLGGIRVNF